MNNKEYNKKSIIIPLRINHKEKSVLELMMKNDEWKNTAGFIKYKIFENKTETIYEKTIKKAKKEDLEIIMSNLLQKIDKEFCYLNYRFNYELDKIEKLEKNNDEKLKKLSARLRYWKDEIEEKTENLYLECEKILINLQVKTERPPINPIELLPESIIEKVSKDWNDTTSPEALEGARRYLENLKKRKKK